MTQMKRIFAALCVALLLTAGIARTMSFFSGPCALLTPDDWFLWWLYDCGKPAAGGGGSGAGQP